MSSGDVKSDFLPHLRRALARDSEAFSKIDIECSICYRKLVANPKDGLQEDPSGKNCHYLVSLACGHIFGLLCLDTWFTHAPRSCPKCRQGSSTKSKNVCYEIFSAEDVRLAPKCLSEGGSFPEVSRGAKYNDFSSISSTIPEVLQKVLGIDGPFIPTSVKHAVNNVGLEVHTEKIKVKDKIFAREKLGFSGKFVIMVKYAWEDRTYIWGCVPESQGVFFLSRFRGSDIIAFDRHRHRLVIKKAKDQKSEHKYIIPLYATEEGYNITSQVLREVNKDRRDVWASPVVGFGLGFVDDGKEDAGRRQLAEVMAGSSFESCVAQALRLILKKRMTPEAKSSLLV